jgi:hypothetical protein
VLVPIEDIVSRCLRALFRDRIVNCARNYKLKLRANDRLIVFAVLVVSAIAAPKNSKSLTYSANLSKRLASSYVIIVHPMYNFSDKLVCPPAISDNI